MPRPLSVEREKEFVEILRFLEFFDSSVRGKSQAEVETLESRVSEIAQQLGKSKALVGLRQAVGDCIERTRDRPIAWVVAFDGECRNRGLRTLSSFRVQYWSRYKSVIRNGQLKSLNDYYLVSSLLNDLSIQLPESERHALSKIISAYEVSHG